MRQSLITYVMEGFVLAFCFSGVVFSQSAIEKILNSPDVPVHFENPNAVPLFIQQASTKVITRMEYQQLVGTAADLGANPSDYYATYPTVTVLNRAHQRIVKWSLMLKRPGDKTRMVVLTGVDMMPGQAYTLDRFEWRPAKTPADLRLPAMWLPTDARDLTIKVAAVTFENGSQWVVPH